MISLTDDQLRCVMTAAAALDYEKRSDFLVRVAALLRLQAGRYSDGDVAEAASRALHSLNPATAA